MTKEELLRKRVIVENLWPGCELDVGDILEKYNDYYLPQGAVGFYSRIPEKEVEPFPYLMRPLQWWEERLPEDMPEYVKRNYEGRTLFYRKELTTIGSMYKYNGLPEGEPPLLNYIGSLLPATREEYEAYQLKIKKS